MISFHFFKIQINANILFSIRIKKSDDNSSAVAVLRILSLVITSFVLILSMCEFGERLTQHFDLFDDAISHCRWYLFPIRMQRDLVIIMANAQQSATLRGFGNTPCVRESFKKVCSVLLYQLACRESHILIIFPSF